MRAARYAIAIGAWVAAGYVSLWVAANTSIGPVVAVFSASHGLHEGDVIVLLAGATVASLITLAAVREPRA